MRRAMGRKAVTSIGLAASATVVALSASAGLGATKTWDGGASTLNWFDGNNWNADGVPTPGTNGFDGDDVNIDISNTAGTAIIVAAGGAGGKSFTLGNTASSYLEVDAGGNLSTNVQGGTALIGGSGTGVLTLNGGAATIRNAFGNLTLGNTATGSGTLIITNGGALTVGGSTGLLVGNAGTGAVSITNGILNGSAAMTFGATGGTGTLNATNATITTNSFVVGAGGTGTVTFNSGTLATTGGGPSMTIGQAGTGTMIVTGGTVGSTNGFTTNLGTGGTGFLGVSGGTVNSSNFNIGTTGTGVGALSIGPGGVLNANALVIGNGGVANVTLTGGTLGTLGGGPSINLGKASNATLTMSGGSISGFSTFVVGDTASGVVNLSGGTASAAGLTLGNTSTGSGSYTFSGGVMAGGTNPTIIVGKAGTGVLNYGVSGSTGFTASGVVTKFVVGNDATGVGTLNFTASSGVSVPAGMTVGLAGRGAVNQGAIPLTLGQGTLLIADQTGSTGTYTISGGSLNLLTTSAVLTVGNGGNGSLYIASDPATNTLFSAGTTAGIVVRNSVSGSGLLSGYGKTGQVGTLTNNGQVVANGGGIDTNVLNLTSFTNNGGSQSVANTIENTTNNGWYATNHGKLQLATVRMTAGSTGANWGEAAGDTQIDLVNSVHTTMTNFTVFGAFAGLDVALLSQDRDELTGTKNDIGNTSLIGVWTVSTTNINGAGPDGNFTTHADDPTIQLTFRYDDVAAGGNTAQLYQMVSGQFELISSTLDTTNKLISTPVYTASGFGGTFAVGVPAPEPSSAALLLLGGLTLFRRRRRDRT